ncbi:hypothetical protein ACIOD1_09005 [Streptomyces sp. NPDC088097]|uniref:hypothetical protein n=1 Tax=Streptomyces sp. NPDC088097 TaxID=3365823 RepID=UPI00381BE5D2
MNAEDRPADAQDRFTDAAYRRVDAEAPPADTQGLPTAPVRGPATAWPLENVLFSAAVLARRLPWTDAPARAVGWDALTREGMTRALLAHLRRTRSGRPVRLGTPFGTFLVPLSADDAAALLARADREDALGPATGLDAGGRRHPLSQHAAPDDALAYAAAPTAEAVRALVAEDAGRLTAARCGDGTLDRREWRAGTRRLARRVVVGAGAVEDTLLSEVVAATTAAVDGRSHGARRAALARRLAPYLDDPDPASLLGGLLAGGLTGEAALPVVAHALSLVCEAASTTALQALALHAVGAADSPERAVDEALRRYPPVAAAVHPARAGFVWQDLEVAAGTEILCAPGWLPHPPGEDGPAPWPGALCTAPAGCSAAHFATLVTGETVRAVLERARPTLIAPRFTADRLPDSLDASGLLVALTDLTGGAGAVPPTVRPATAVPDAASGHAPAVYGARARASAERLDRHAESLAACAGDPGWNEDETGEHFRTVLLAHADRCAKAASDVRTAARRLVE